MIVLFKPLGPTQQMLKLTMDTSKANIRKATLLLELVTRASQSAPNRAARELSRYAEVMAADTVPCDAVAPFPARVRRPRG